MGEKIRVALNSSEPCVVSKIYPVFEIKNNVDLIWSICICGFQEMILNCTRDFILGVALERLLIGKICAMLNYPFQILKFKKLL